MWGDTYRVFDGSGIGLYRCPHCKITYPQFIFWEDFLMDHLRICERDYRHG